MIGNYGESSPFDLVHLEGKDEYTKYISKTLFAFNMLANLYKLKTQRDDEANEESKIVLYYLNKLLHTFEALRMKYLFNPDGKLKIDKSDSGFVNFSEINAMQTDLEFSDQTLESIGDPNVIRDNMLTFMLRFKEEPKEYLEKMGKYVYTSMLLDDHLFFFYNPGELVRGESNDTVRKYSYHWACYDRNTNMPYIYLLDFEQDIDAEPIDSETTSHSFFDVIKSEGSRAPAAGIVAMAIDQRLEDIHPKMLKRICIGPIYSNSFSEGINDELQKMLEQGDEGEQFTFHIVEQFVFSQGQQVVSDGGILSSILEGKRIREKFYIPKPKSVDEYSSFNELEEQKASMIRKNVIMPYKLHQHLSSFYDGFKIISFNKEGVINGI
jgi:hypothetical protein